MRHDVPRLDVQTAELIATGGEHVLVRLVVRWLADERRRFPAPVLLLDVDGAVTRVAALPRVDMGSVVAEPDAAFWHGYFTADAATIVAADIAVELEGLGRFTLPPLETRDIRPPTAGRRATPAPRVASPLGLARSLVAERLLELAAHERRIARFQSLVRLQAAPILPRDQAAALRALRARVGKGLHAASLLEQRLTDRAVTTRQAEPRLLPTDQVADLRLRAQEGLATSRQVERRLESLLASLADHTEAQAGNR